MIKRIFKYVLVTLAVYVLLALSLLYLVVECMEKDFALFPFIVLFVAVGLFSGTLFLYGPGVRTAEKSLMGKWIAVPLSAVLSLAVLSVYVTVPQGWNTDWLASTGALFVVIMALITFVGFLLTVTRLEEIHGRILDYPHLGERLDKLIDIEYERINQKFKRKKGKIYILANAPALGNVSARDEFQVFKDRLTRLLKDDVVSVRIACHSWISNGGTSASLDQFYAKHWGAALATDKLADAVKESKDILNAIQGVKASSPAEKRLFSLTNPNSEVPFHLFMTSDRAILFTALSFPEEMATSAVDQKPANAAGLEEKDKVKIVGFETGDRSILKALELGFNRRIFDKNIFTEQ